MSDKVPSNTPECSHEQKLENIQKKVDELNKMKYALQNVKENKQSESYPRVFSENKTILIDRIDVNLTIFM